MSKYFLRIVIFIAFLLGVQFFYSDIFLYSAKFFKYKPIKTAQAAPPLPGAWISWISGCGPDCQTEIATKCDGFDRPTTQCFLLNGITDGCASGWTSCGNSINTTPCYWDGHNPFLGCNLPTKCSTAYQACNCICSATPPLAQCADGIDNDVDTLTDFPADPGCSSATDNDETNAPPLVPVTIFFLNPGIFNDLTALINQIIKVIYTIAFPVVILLLIIAGYLFLAAGGDAQKVAQAKRLVFYALGGLLIIILSLVISALIDLAFG